MNSQNHISLGRLGLLTFIVLVAFAGNSLLARTALEDGAIGAGMFTFIRLLSGAVMLALLVGLRAGWGAGTWRGALALFGYAAGFSFAYLELSTGTGALILFALVQLTMLGTGFASGERLSTVQWLGAGLAFAGLVVLLLPGLDAPSPVGALLMAVAGISWGTYSLLGRGGGDATARTSGNFARAALLAAVCLPVAMVAEGTAVPLRGAGLAVLSGAVTSGLGYALWYRVLPSLSASRAGLVQLAVPPLAAAMGIAVLGEALTLPFAAASALILFGIWLSGREA